MDSIEKSQIGYCTLDSGVYNKDMPSAEYADQGFECHRPLTEMMEGVYARKAQAKRRQTQYRAAKARKAYVAAKRQR